MIRVAILGTGNIGTDLLVKAKKSNFLEVTAFVGRRLDSDGMKVAIANSVPISDQGIQYFIDNPGCCDLVYDCTNALDAMEHAPIFKSLNIKVREFSFFFRYNFDLVQCHENDERKRSSPRLLFFKCQKKN